MTLAVSLKYSSTSVPSASRPEYIPPLSFLNLTRAARVKAGPCFTDGLSSAFGCFAHNSAIASTNVIAAHLRKQETEVDMQRWTGSQAGRSGRRTQPSL